MRSTKLGLLVILVVCSLAVHATGDNATVQGKIAAAQKAVVAGARKAAAAELTAVANMLIADAAGAGEYANEVASWEADAARKVADALTRNAEIRESALEVMAMRADQLYGAVIPAGKGDLAAAAAYLRKAASESAGKTKTKLEAAGAAVAGAAAGKGDKAEALALMRITLGCSVCMVKAEEYLTVQRAKAAGAWLSYAADYLLLEQKVANEKVAEEILDLLTGVNATVFDLEQGIPLDVEEVTGMMEDAERTIVDAYRGTGPAGESKKSE